jgi:hypothetical protein
MGLVDYVIEIQERIIHLTGNYSKGENQIYRFGFPTYLILPFLSSFTA